MILSDSSNVEAAFSMLISSWLARAAVGENADDGSVNLHEDESRASNARLCSRSWLSTCANDRT